MALWYENADYYSLISLINSLISYCYCFNNSPALSDKSVFLPYIQFPLGFGASTNLGCKENWVSWLLLNNQRNAYKIFDISLYEEVFLGPN